MLSAKLTRDGCDYMLRAMFIFIINHFPSIANAKSFFPKWNIWTLGLKLVGGRGQEHLFFLFPLLAHHTFRWTIWCWCLTLDFFLAHLEQPYQRHMLLSLRLAATHPSLGWEVTSFHRSGVHLYLQRGEVCALATWDISSLQVFYLAFKQ